MSKLISADEALAVLHEWEAAACRIDHPDKTVGVMNALYNRLAQFEDAASNRSWQVAKAEMRRVLLELACQSMTAIFDLELSP